jgi:nitroimidazol reductase NimA-like FMN-containing flavoprotein (pyridoxamine 5'-phosphate oxidase superfamily)
MRREDRRISEQEAGAILVQGAWGVLSTSSKAQGPYGVPLSYCYFNGSLYFHCAPVGRKLDDIREEERVSFCVVGRTQTLPEKFSMSYESVIVSGVASECTGDEKVNALDKLIRKYSPDHLEAGFKYARERGDRAKVYKIAIHDICGKARR